MKQIVCEMCEGTEFLKDDGMFVCQNCGTKYSLEEAKKLMVEVSESTPAAPAEESQKIANLRKLAERAKEDGDSEMAAKYFEQLLLECPDDWKARFYTTYYAAHNIKIAQIGSAANKVSGVIGPTFQMIKDSENEIDCAAAYISLTADVISFSTMLFNNITPNLGSTTEIACRNIDNWVIPTISMMVTVGDELQDKFPGKVTALLAQKVYDSAFNYSQSTHTWTPSARTLHRKILNRRSTVADAIREFEDEERRQKEIERKQKIEAYWEAHAEEKAALEQEKQTLTEKINELKAQIKAIEQKNTPKIVELEDSKKAVLPAEQAVKDQLQLISNLRTEQSNLGIFKGKQKKAIEARLQDVELPKATELKNTAAQARKDHDAAIKKQIDALNDEPNELRMEQSDCKKRIAQIDDELTKER